MKRHDKIGLHLTQIFSHKIRTGHKLVRASQIHLKNLRSPLQASKKQAFCVVMGLFYLCLPREVWSGSKGLHDLLNVNGQQINRSGSLNKLP